MDIFEEYTDFIFTRKVFDHSMDMVIRTMTDVFKASFEEREFERLVFDLRKNYSERYEASRQIYLDCLKDHFSAEQVKTMLNFYQSNPWFGLKQQPHLADFGSRFEQAVAAPVVEAAMRQSMDFLGN